MKLCAKQCSRNRQIRFPEGECGLPLPFHQGRVMREVVLRFGISSRRVNTTCPPRLAEFEWIIVDATLQESDRPCGRQLAAENRPGQGRASSKGAGM